MGSTRVGLMCILGAALAVRAGEAPRDSERATKRVLILLGENFEEIEFAAFNLGTWLFHCHKPMHMDGGMAMIVNIA